MGMHMKNPIDEASNVNGAVAQNTPVTAGTHDSGQDCHLDNLIAEAGTVDFEILVDSTVIAFGSFLVL